MQVPSQELLRVQTRAFNARDLETLVGPFTAAARFIRDGEWVGEGRDAVRKGLEAELSSGSHGRLLLVDGEPVLVEYDGEEGHPVPRGTIRFEVEGSQLTQCVVDHDGAVVERLRSLHA